MQTALLWAAAGTGFTFLMTTLGAASVFLFRKRNSMAAPARVLGLRRRRHDRGFRVVAAHSRHRARRRGRPDRLDTRRRAGSPSAWRSSWCCTSCCRTCIRARTSPKASPASGIGPTLLFTAVTLHNIPEGMSVGLLFAMAAQDGGDPAMFGMAVALAIGIGIQNVPEGAAVALPLLQEGMSAPKAFGLGALSGLAEPVFGILVVLFAGRHRAVHALDAGIFCRRHDVRGGGGTHSRGASGRAFECRHPGRHGGISGDDDPGRGAGL